MKIKKIQLDKNKSVFFLLPLTFIPKIYFEKAVDYFALNSHKPELTKHIFVLFDKDVIEDFEIQRLQNFSVYESIEEYGEFLLVNFKLPSIFNEDHKLFLDGKYSKYSDKAKAAIQSHLPNKVKIGKDWFMSESFKILYPTNDSRIALGNDLGIELDDEAEIYSSPDLEHETFNICKYYNLFKEKVNK